MKLKPRAVVFIGVAFTSLSSILVRVSEAPPLVVATYRMAFSVLFLVPLAIAGRKPRRTASAGGIRPRDLALSVLSGLFLAVHFGTWITSLSLTTVANSTILVTTHPLIVALLGIVVLGERLSWKSVVFMIVAFAGSVLLVFSGLGGGASTATGNILALAGAGAVSGYMIVGRIVRRRVSANSYTLIVYPVAALLLALCAVVLDQPLYPYPAREFVIFAALALFCQMLGHSLFNWAVKYVRPTLISTTILLEPVIATTLALILFREVPGPLSAVGGAVILAAIYFFVRQEARETPGGR